MVCLVLKKKKKKNYADIQYSTSMKNIEEWAAIKGVSSLHINNKYPTLLCIKIENL